MHKEEIIAEKIMKWKTDEESGRWIVSGGLLGKSYWQPFSSLRDAWVVLESFSEGLVRKRLGGLDYRAWVMHEGKEFTAHGRTPSEAICNVALKAYRISD
jgi:hypothetical protein